MKDYKYKNQYSDYRKFGLLFSFIAVFINLYLYTKGSILNPLLFSTIALIVLSILIPSALKYPYIAWMSFANVMGWVMTRVILSFLFYLIISPISLLLRLFGKNFLETKWDNSLDTYWNYREKLDKSDLKEYYEKQF